MTEFVWLTQPLFVLEHHLTHCAHGSNPRVQEPLVLSLTVEVHHLPKPTLISDVLIYRLLHSPLALPTRMLCNPKAWVMPIRFICLFTNANLRGYSSVLLFRGDSQLPRSQPALHIWSTDWNDVHFALTTNLVEPCDVVGAALIQFPPCSWAFGHLIVHPHNFWKTLSGERLPSALMPLDRPNTALWK